MHLALQLAVDDLSNGGLEQVIAEEKKTISREETLACSCVLCNYFGKESLLCNNIHIFRYVPEGNMTACGTDYLNKDWISRSYILVYSIFVYYMPLFTIIYSYYFIVSVSTRESVRY